MAVHADPIDPDGHGIEDAAVLFLGLAGAFQRLSIAFVRRFDLAREDIERAGKGAQFARRQAGRLGRFDTEVPERVGIGRFDDRQNASREVAAEDPTEERRDDQRHEHDPGDDHALGGRALLQFEQRLNHHDAPPGTGYDAIAGDHVRLPGRREER